VKKLAIFVEGQTEQIFVEKLLKEIAGRNNIAIKVVSLNGKQGSRITTVIMSDPVITTTKFYVLVYNSGSDSNVVSDMRDRFNSLKQSGYERIIGLRDVYPIAISDKLKLESGLRYYLPKDTIPIDIVLAVMEIEAWFLAEWSHFMKVNPLLTPENIQANFGFNPKIDDMEARHHPADDLHQIYRLVGRAYKKTKNQVNTIVSNLDYDFMYVELVNNVVSFREFIKLIDLFISL
jgi:hypothetical protein